jgi:uncharacterized membrane protein (Fun14 family)
LPVATRFWLGSFLPALALGAIVGLLIATGEGRREAPMIVFFASLVAVPALALLNSWVLFVNWYQRSRLVASASVLPGVFALGCILFIHGSGRWQELGMLPLLPFLMVPMNGLGTLAVLWAVALAALLIAARRLDASRRLM